MEYRELRILSNLMWYQEIIQENRRITKSNGKAKDIFKAKI
jgi:hypothetical protein